jgi:hypothetical protein
MLVTVGELLGVNSLQYKITDKEYRVYDSLYMKSVLECSGVATIVTESHFKGLNFSFRSPHTLLQENVVSTNKVAENSETAKLRNFSRDHKFIKKLFRGLISSTTAAL